MTIFKNYTFTWWQMALFKLCLLSLGVAIGANWPLVFVGYTTLLLVVAIGLGLYLTYVTLQK